MLPIFRGTLSGLVLHSLRSFFLSLPLITTGLFNSPVGKIAYFCTLHRRLSYCTRGSAFKIPTNTTIIPIFNPRPAHSLLSNHPITSHYSQFAAMPNLSSAVKLFAIIRNSISPALAVTRNAISPKLLPSSNISSSKPGLKRHVLSLTHA